MVGEELGLSGMILIFLRRVDGLNSELATLYKRQRQID